MRARWHLACQAGWDSRWPTRILDIRRICMAKKDPMTSHMSMLMRGRRRTGGRKGSAYGGKKRRGSGMAVLCVLGLRQARRTYMRTPTLTPRVCLRCMKCDSRLRSLITFKVTISSIICRRRLPFITSKVGQLTPMPIRIPDPILRWGGQLTKGIIARTRLRMLTHIHSRMRTRAYIILTIGRTRGIL